MKRLVSLLVVMIGLGSFAWWWTADDPAWACGADDGTSGCTTRSKLDIAGLELARPRLEFRSLGASPDGTEVVAGILDIDPEGGANRGVVAVFDAKTGDQNRVLVAIDDTNGRVEVANPTYSPDGSLVVVRIRDADGGALVVLDAETGDERARLLAGVDGRPTDCVGRLGFSPGNDLLQCGSAIIDVDSNRIVERSEDGNRFAAYAGGFAWSVQNATAHVSGDLIEVAHPDRTNDLTRVRLPGFDIGTRDAVGFSPDGEFLVATVAHRDFGWSAGAPARSRPGGSLGVVDLESEQVLAEVDLPAPLDVVEWSGDGRWLLGVTDDLTLYRFEVSGT